MQHRCNLHYLYHRIDLVTTLAQILETRPAIGYIEAMLSRMRGIATLTRPAWTKEKCE
jgi:hypothetical protein